MKTLIDCIASFWLWLIIGLIAFIFGPWIVVLFIVFSPVILILSPLLEPKKTVDYNYD